MNGVEGTIAAARALARSAPPSVLRPLAASLLLNAEMTLDEARSAINSAHVSHSFKRAAEELTTRWKSEAPDLPPSAVAGALIAAETSDPVAEELALIWSGPDVAGTGVRRTDQALVEVIDAARSELSIVSFVARRLPELVSAVNRAANRGVHVRVLLESSQDTDQRIQGGEIGSILDVHERVHLFVWPREKRHSTPSGRVGALHAKFAVADDSKLFVSSANLTGHAWQLNIELGVLIEGGRLPSQARDLVRGLEYSGTIVEVPGR